MSANGTTWATAVNATLHCLTGCAIGEVLGMVLATWWGWGDLASIALAIVLAFFFGYLLTYTSVRRHGLLAPGGRPARTRRRHGLDHHDGDRRQRDPAGRPRRDGGRPGHGLFWGSLAFALAVAFVLTVPVNHWLISRGRGHAAVHEMHGHH